MTKPINICVYCGSSTKVPAEYIALAGEVGTLIAQGGHTLVWGGGTVGMMGAVALAAQNAGGRVIGILPKFMAGTEVAYERADELIIVDDMRQRKALMELKAHGFLVLPGGVGTMDEMFEIMSLRVLEQHDKHMVILNHAGFYEHLLRFMEHLYALKFARADSRSHYHVAATAQEAIDALSRHFLTPSPLTGGGRGQG